MKLKSKFIFLSLAFSVTTVHSNEVYAMPTNNIIQPIQIIQSKKLPSQFDNLKGKTVYVDFWASWCPPCRLSFIFMERLKEKYQNKGLQILAINVDQEKNDAIKFLKDHPTSLEIVYDNEGMLPVELEMKHIPSSYIFNQKGDLVSVHNGFKQEDAENIEKEILNILNNK